MTYKPKYTPGPWFAWEGNPDGTNRDTRYVSYYSGKKIYGSPVSETICFMPHKEFGPDSELNAANARLIATAPELVEALTKAYYRLCSIQYYERYSVKGQQELAFIRDTLAKATGIDDELVQNGELYKGD